MASKALQAPTSELLLNAEELAAVTGEAPALKHHVYPVVKFSERYNGRGGPGTGGPKTDWLKKAGDRWISHNKPELHDTRLAHEVLSRPQNHARVHCTL